MSASRHRARNLVLIVAAVLVAGWLIPPFFHAGRYRKVLRSTLENRLGREVNLGAITLQLLPHPGFVIRNVVIEEDPGFGSEPLARVGEMECDLRWRSIWGSHLDCSRIVLHEPVLNIVRNVAGEWNIGGFIHRGGAPAVAVTALKRQRPRPFELDVDGGRVNFTIDSVKKPFALDSVEANVQFHPHTGVINFQLQGTPVRTDVNMQPPGPFQLTGQWKPAAGLNGPFHARLTTQGALISGWLPLALRRDPGIYGVMNADLRLDGSIHHVHATGRVAISQLHLLDSLPPPSSVPVNITLSADWDQDQRELRIQKASAAFAASVLQVSGALSQAKDGPLVDLTVAFNHAQLGDLVALANRLSRHPTGLGITGRVNGQVEISGPWEARNYRGSVAIDSLGLSSRGVDAVARQATLQFSGDTASLAPARFRLGERIEGIVQGHVALPAGRAEAKPSREKRDLKGYQLVFAVPRSPLASCARVARSLRPGRLRDVGATGWASATVRLTGRAWPFSRPQVNAEGDIDSARLLVAGLTEPLVLRQVHLTLRGGSLVVSPMIVGIGGTTITGWLRRSGQPGAPWTFAARTPQLDLAKASLWFSALGYRRPMPILDLIPGLRSLARRVAARRNVFSALNAEGSFESPTVKFHTLTFGDVRARIRITGREARISNAEFSLAGGKGDAAGRIDFRRSPAQVATSFTIAGVRLRRFTSRLPSALSRIRGVVSAAGHVTTRGLTRPEMAAHLSGQMEVDVRNVSLGAFDPLAAVARAAALGTLAPERGTTILPPLRATLRVENGAVHMAPLHLHIGGAPMQLAGEYDFNGHADFSVRADLGQVRRRWLTTDGGSLRDAPARRVAQVNLAGPLKSLAVTPVETAQSKR